MSTNVICMHADLFPGYQRAYATVKKETDLSLGMRLLRILSSSSTLYNIKTLYPHPPPEDHQCQD